VAYKAFPVGAHNDHLAIQLIGFLEDLGGRISKNDLNRGHSLQGLGIILKLPFGEFIQPIPDLLDTRPSPFFL